MNVSTSRTFYLFATPSFVEGVARVFDLGGTLEVYNEHATGEEADRAALKRDWVVVGDDLRSAIKQYDYGAVK